MLQNRLTAMNFPLFSISFSRSFLPPCRWIREGSAAESPTEIPSARGECRGKQSPYYGSDISGKEAGYGSEKVADNYNDKCKCPEMNGARDQRDGAQISPKDTCQNTKYNKENDVNK